MALSDHLADAPDEVILEFVGAMMRGDRREEALPLYTEWVSRDGFAADRRRTFLARSRNLTRTPAGRHRDLRDSVRRLTAAGLITAADTEDAVFSWTCRPNLRRVGYCSTLMRVVAVSCALDDPEVPEHVLDYVVYHEVLHLRQGHRPFRRPHDREFAEAERAYPRKGECDAFLRALGRGTRRR